MSKYLLFSQVYFTGKTKRFEIISKSSGNILGRIAWKKEWRRYALNPNSAFETFWDKDCLNDIENFLDKLMYERKIKKAREKNK